MIRILMKVCYDLPIDIPSKTDRLRVFLQRIIDAPEAGKKEFFSSWALFILIVLLIFALFTSYILQQRKIQAVHETVLSIFAGESTRFLVCGDVRLVLMMCYCRNVCWIDHSAESRVADSR
jgi:hypothetical protein